MNLDRRQQELAWAWGCLIAWAAVSVLACMTMSGCSSWQGIDVKIRPGGKIHPDEQATPPAKEPDPYDWEPWWSRPRPKPERRGHEAD